MGEMKVGGSGKYRYSGGSYLPDKMQPLTEAKSPSSMQVNTSPQNIAYRRNVYEFTASHLPVYDGVKRPKRGARAAIVVDGKRIEPCASSNPTATHTPC